MKILTVITILVCADQVASAAVIVYPVPRPPTEAIWFTHTMEFDFAGNLPSDIVVQENNTQCIGNEVSVSCSTGFQVNFSSSVQVFASTEVLQVLHGAIIGESIHGADGGWTLWNSLYFEYRYGTAGGGYNTELISERFAVPIRLVSGSGFKYGFLDISMLKQTLNLDGSTSERIGPHVVGIGLETDVNKPVSTFAIPEPSSAFLMALGFCALAAVRQRNGEAADYKSPLPSKSANGRIFPL